MKKEIIVTTDFSVHSKAGIRFAIQYASQHSAPLVFLNIIELLIPTRWNDVKEKIYMDEEIETTTEALRKFVKDLYKECKVRPRKFECVVRYGSPVDRAIADYALERKAGFICMSTRGAGLFRRIVGTYTSSVIKNSPVPVFAIPKNYKRVPIREVMYASDLGNLRNELSRVKRFADTVEAKINVVHYEHFIDKEDTKTAFSELVRRYGSSNVDFHLERYDLKEQPLAYYIKKAIRKFQPSIIVLFTNQSRNWYDRIFFPSKSADVTYNTQKPILVFPKDPTSKSLCCIPP